MNIEDITKKTIPKKGTKMKITKEAANFSNHLFKLKDKVLIVNEVKEADLGDMKALVVYFDTSKNTKENPLVRNPYLLEHFELWKT